MERNKEGDAFEGEVKKAKEDRASVQKRTFTRWVNSHLKKKEGMPEMVDLFTDLRDGILLLELLQILTGEVLPKLDRGKAATTPYVKAANVGKSLDFLKKKKVQLENIGPNDLVDGNPSLTLGLLWTLILRFQIQDISVDELSAKDALLLWVKKKTKGYPGVAVNDFHKSFRDGLAFNALIHAHRPDLIKYNALKPDEWVVNLNNAFTVAEDKLGIVALLDAPDVAVERPDEKSIMTYVAALYHYFSSMAKGDVATQRVSNIVQELDEIQAMAEEYDRKAGDLLAWIKSKVDQLDERDFPNTLAGVQGLQGDFKNFLTVEKPPKLKEKSELESQLFNIQSKLRALNRPRFKPAEGKALHEINQAWSVLETSEHDREVALTEELLRLQKLEEDAKRFNKKVEILESWLSDTQKLIAGAVGENVTNLEASLKKHEAILADASAKEERIKKLLVTARYLDSEDYHGRDGINQRANALEERWHKLNDDLLAKKDDLNEAFKLQEFHNEARKVLDLIKDTKSSASSQNYGEDLDQVEDMLKIHALAEAEVSSAGEKIKGLEASAGRIAQENPRHAGPVQEKLAEIKSELGELQAHSKDRKEKLEKSLVFYNVLASLEDEDVWIQEREPAARSTDYGKDYTSAQNLFKRHEALLASIQNHEGIIKPVLAEAHAVGSSDHFRKADIQDKVAKVEKRWGDLQNAARDRREKLEAATLSTRYSAAADDAEQFIQETEPLLDTEDLGEDEESALALLKRHQEVVSELDSYEFNINALRALCKELVDRKNPESGSASKRQEAIDARWAALRSKAAARKRALEEADKFHRFNRDAEDVGLWIDNKQNFLQEAKLSDNLDNLDSLQRKFDELDRDFAQQDVKRKELNANGEALVRDNHPAKEAIAERQHKLNDSWDQLAADVAARKAQLKDAAEATDLLSSISDVNDLLKQKEKLAASEETGKDLPSVLAQKKRHEGLGRDLDELAAKVNDLDKHARKFVETHQDSLASTVLAERQKELAANLAKVKALADERAKKLDDSHELHKFLNGAHEVDQLLAQKAKETDAIERPKDARAAEAGLRRLDKVQKAVEAADEPLGNVQRAGEKLAASGHPASTEIREKVDKLVGDRRELGDKLKAKEKELHDVHDVERFRENCTEALAWIANKRREADAQDVPKDPADAQKMIKRAEELKIEVEAYDDRLKAVHSEGAALAARDHPEKEAVEALLKKLAADKAALGDAVHGRRRRLDESLALLGFDRDAQEIEDWLEEAASSIAGAGRPETVEAAEEELKRMEALQAAAKLEAPKVKNLDTTATRLIGEDHHAKDHIGKRRDDLVGRWGALENALGGRRRDLQNAAKLKQFLKDSDELLASLHDKPDPNSKELEVELAAKRKKMEDLKRALTALELVDGFDAAAARKKLAEIEEQMGALGQETEKAAKHNREAAALQQLDRGFNDLDLWFREVEAVLASEDLGADLPAVQALIKRHTALEADIRVHEAPVGESLKAAQALIDSGHHAADAVRQKREALAARYAAVQDKDKARRARLEDSLAQHKFLRDVEEERQYVKYKTAIASSTDYGRDPTSSQKLHNKHKVLAEELATHETAVYVPLRAAGDRLLAEKVVPTEAVTASLGALAQDWERLKGLVDARHKALGQAAAYLEFKADQDDELRWAEGQVRVLEAAELPGDSPAACAAMTKKNDALLSDIRTHDELVVALKATGDELIAKGSIHALDIRQGQEELAAQHATLKQLAAARKAALEAANQRQQFFADANDLQMFVRENTEPLGAPLLDGSAAQKQLEELKVLEVKLEAEAAQAARLANTRKELVASNHPDKEVIERKYAEVSKEWDDIKYKQGERRRQLTKKIENFRDADDKCLVVAEKAAALNNWIDNTSEDLSDPVGVDSVDEAQKLKQSHADFQHSLKKPTDNYEEVVTLSKEIRNLGVLSNPYTPFTVEALSGKWEGVLTSIEDRTDALEKEIAHQKENDKLRMQFADEANHFARWLERSKIELLEGGVGSLEEQLDTVKIKNEQIETKGEELAKIQELAQTLEAALILDNRFTEHSAISLGQKLESLRQLGTVMVYNIEQKILAKNVVAVSDAQKKEWSDTFDYFDKDKSGALDYIEFKACLRGSGYNLPTLPEGQRDEEFEQILAFVDADANGQVSKREFIDFMISQKNTNITSAADVMNSFMMIAQERSYVTEYQLRQILPVDQVEFCLKNMKKTPDGYDYKSFVNSLFANDDAPAPSPSSEPPTPTAAQGGKDLAAVRAEKLRAMEQERIKRQEELDSAAKEVKAKMDAEKAAREAERKEEQRKQQEEAEARRRAAAETELQKRAEADAMRKKIQEEHAAREAEEKQRVADAIRQRRQDDAAAGAVQPRPPKATSGDGEGDERKRLSLVSDNPYLKVDRERRRTRDITASLLAEASGDTSSQLQRQQDAGATSFDRPSQFERPTLNKSASLLNSSMRDAAAAQSSSPGASAAQAELSKLRVDRDRRRTRDITASLMEAAGIAPPQPRSPAKADKEESKSPAPAAVESPKVEEPVKVETKAPAPEPEGAKSPETPSSPMPQDGEEPAGEEKEKKKKKKSKDKERDDEESPKDEDKEEKKKKKKSKDKDKDEEEAGGEEKEKKKKKKSKDKDEEKAGEGDE